MQKEQRKINKPDKKSLEVLKLLDQSIERQYMEEANRNHEDRSQQSAANELKCSEFSPAYEKKKKLLLEGKVDEVKRELEENKRSRNIRKFGKVAAAILIGILCLSFFIRPQKITAALKNFGNALVSVFDTHTELSYDAGDEHKTLEKLDFGALIPDGYFLEDELVTPRHAYALYQSSGDKTWISFREAIKDSTTVAFDSQDARVKEYMVASTPVSMYEKENEMTFVWVVEDVIYTLSGSADESLLQDLMKQLVKRSIEQK